MEKVPSGGSSAQTTCIVLVSRKAPCAHGSKFLLAPDLQPAGVPGSLRGCTPACHVPLCRPLLFTGGLLAVGTGARLTQTNQAEEFNLKRPADQLPQHYLATSALPALVLASLPPPPPLIYTLMFVS